MTFQRFDTSAAAWSQTERQPATAMPEAADPRIQEARAAIDALGCMRRPSHFSEERWFELLKDLRHVCDHWLDLALACGGSLLDLFGSAPTLNGRAGLMGAAMLLRGRQIDSIDGDRIVIGNRLGPPNVFYRGAPGVAAPFDRTGAKLIWGILNGGSSL